jgi:hypothetical protein
MSVIETSPAAGGPRPHDVVFLVDVDDTLRDNDLVQDDIRRHFERAYGPACRERYWAILEQLLGDLGYRDYLGAQQPILYVKGLAAPLTVNTMPENTLKAFAEHGEPGPLVTADGGDCEAVLAAFAGAGVGLDALAAKLQDDGAAAFVASWNELLKVIASKSAALGLRAA